MMNFSSKQSTYCKIHSVAQGLW